MENFQGDFRTGVNVNVVVQDTTELYLGKVYRLLPISLRLLYNYYLSPEWN